MPRQAAFLIVLALLSSTCAAFVPATLLGGGLRTAGGKGEVLGALAKGARFRPMLQQQVGRVRRGGVGGLVAAEDGLGMNEIGDLAILGALQKLRGGMVKKRRTIHFPGCINESYKFSCESRNFFVKINRALGAHEMFEGEAGALQAMRYAGMSAPRPLRYGDLPHGGSYLIMDFKPFQPFLMMETTSQSALGEQLAMMHLHQPERHQFFGFGHNTLLGTTPMDNTWSPSWANFFVENRLRPAFELMHDRDIATPSIKEHAAAVCERAHEILMPLDLSLRPSTLHGDLWLGNAGITSDGEVSVYDPSSFYGHSEFDLAFRGWPSDHGFPGLSEAFYTAYHFHIPREQGYEERGDLYRLFHLINHACMFGEGEYVQHVEDLCSKVLCDSMAP
mmetsp:Transcript_36925/g.72054  ORF Transcript_36925/g.72054 Transcript_36925/m.72054 type:complete len:391 (+) Transcript_36925:194-1366(+)|eukprot:CAMPEP_0173382552 /NCGR_PEP_ID=MMETSP1356-20130122/5069_1 /TAXON_ID=77927 ORGANISM="Hemiselmis virescens, Strain PCC157" /NCGR_SAMPLE_ID=MMETSP1356 /ASSEMBLY_ACC=CAM_ASM_000847 /LENGTH=390 /DNA_ID=CAMNT_0014336961 /DNA_START=189 /DNA_END=1361 /DNA_ORIENTATION=-